MKKINSIGLLLGILLLPISGVCQNTLQFTSVKATSEKAIQFYWASNTNEVYEIDYADALAGNDDGSTSWNKLYDDYPSHGTNTFVADDGNYDASPETLHPKLSPMRFYRVTLIESNTSPTNPFVSISSPTNGASLSGSVAIQVSASSPEILSEINLYIDGEKQWPSDDGSNFVINTCEWPNGSHTLFATAKSQSGLEGIPNSGPVTYGRSVSSYLNVSFNNLISEFNFSQPFFEPALGQTQAVTATFAANVNWTLQIQDVNTNTVRTASGSGISMEFDWDGTGTGATNIPDGVYSYVISAATNGGSFMSMMSGSFSSSASTRAAIPEETTELWALSPENAESPLPLALFPPGFNTNGFTLFEALPSEVRELTKSLAAEPPARTIKTKAIPSSASGGSFAFESSLTSSSSTATSQSSRGPTRKPDTGVKGTLGTFGILYKTYSLDGFSSPHPTTGFPFPLPTRVAIDGQIRTAQTVDSRILEFTTIANDFSAGMKKAGWKSQFVKADAQWGATDIKKSSLGGTSIFNTCNFGLLMTHGSYGNSGSTGTENDNVRYTYSWLGANDYVRLSDMDFGSSGTTGLRWMTIYACNILKSANYSSMNSAGKIPVNENLHLFLGPSSFTYAFQAFGDRYSHYMTEGNEEIVAAFNHAGIEQADFNQRGVSNTITFAVSGWQACLHDKLSAFNDPDPDNGLQYQETTIFTYPP